LPRLRRARQRPSLLQHVVTQRTNRDPLSQHDTTYIMCRESARRLSGGSSEIHSGDIVL
jgi:hypothetical protein